MKVQKLIAFTVLLGLLVLVLSACGTQATPPVTEPALATENLNPPTPPPVADTLAPPATDTGVTQPTESAAVSSGSYTNDVLPILESRCISCHGGEQTRQGLDMKTYASLMAGSLNGPVVTPGDAGGSVLVQQLLNGKMPKRGPKLTPDQVQVIADWINSGALNN